MWTEGNFNARWSSLHPWSMSGMLTKVSEKEISEKNPEKECVNRQQAHVELHYWTLLLQSKEKLVKKAPSCRK